MLRYSVACTGSGASQAVASDTESGLHSKIKATQKCYFLNPFIQVKNMAYINN